MGRGDTKSSSDFATASHHQGHHFSLCSRCDSAYSDCGCTGCKRRFVYIDDGSSPYDRLERIPSVVYGYQLPDPAPVSPDIVLTLLAGDTDEYELAPGPLSNMATMEALLGFDAETKVGDMLAIFGYPAPNQALNTIYYVTSLPTTFTPWYVIRRTDPFGRCGLREGNFIQVQLGTSAGDATFKITAIVNGPPRSMEVEITNYGANVNFYCLEWVKAPKC